MDVGLDGKVVAVTGASRGIGRDIAVAAGAENAKVAAMARTEADLEETLGLIPGDDHSKMAVVCDVTDPDDLMKAMVSVREGLGGLDVLVNNAGQRQDFDRVDELDIEEWRSVIDANLSSVFYATQAAVGSMIEQQAGSIVNIASIAGPVGFARIGAYTAAKAGVIALTKVMAIEWAEFGIRANAVAPGWIKSPMNIELRTDPANAEFYEVIKSQSLQKRFGESSDVASAVMFLAGSTAGYITGETIVVDGGWLAV